MPDPRKPAFYARSVHDVARDLVGCIVRHDGVAGRIVEVESYHEEEPACHAYAGLTPRTRILFGAPGFAEKSSISSLSRIPVPAAMTLAPNQSFSV